MCGNRPQVDLDRDDTERRISRTGRRPAQVIERDLIADPARGQIADSARSLANLAKRNLAQLTAQVKTRLKRMQFRPALIEGFLASTRLDFSPFCNPTIKHRVSELLGYDVR